MSSKSPAEIAEAMCAAGYKKTTLPIGKMFLLGILAGVYIGFGAQLMTTVKVGLADAVGSGFANFLGGAVFSVGLMLVVLGGAELFTGNNLVVTACLSGRVTFAGLLRNWVVVYMGNFVGSLLLVFIMFNAFYAYRDPGSMGALAIAVADAKVNLHFVEAMCRGIGCNWLVCLAVWLAASAHDTTGKIFACFFPIMAFVAIGLEHSVANMYFIPMGLLLKGVGLEASPQLNWGGFILNNLVPVTIGNLIGGALFVGIVYWYMYLHEKE
ncbi:formate/nitrite transporter family protein [Candidatus Bathyarchaeota archaeon]|nr:formate/nitrite transporter family protein [Candidatus Bathyarchaeota archaeon]